LVKFSSIGSSNLTLFVGSWPQ